MIVVLTSAILEHMDSNETQMLYSLVGQRQSIYHNYECTETGRTSSGEELGVVFKHVSVNRLLKQLVVEIGYAAGKDIKEYVHREYIIHTRSMRETKRIINCLEHCSLSPVLLQFVTIYCNHHKHWDIFGWSGQQSKFISRRKELLMDLKENIIGLEWED